jgi:hypothetical protein
MNPTGVAVSRVVDVDLRDRVTIEDAVASSWRPPASM